MLENVTSAYILITYVSYSASLIFELVLFFLALWIGIRCFKSNLFNESDWSSAPQTHSCRGKCAVLPWVSVITCPSRPD